MTMDDLVADVVAASCAGVTMISMFGIGQREYIICSEVMNSERAVRQVPVELSRFSLLSFDTGPNNDGKLNIVFQGS